MLIIYSISVEIVIMSEKSNTLLSIITLSLIYALSCIFKMSSNVVMPIFQERFMLSSTFLGVITGSYYYLYAPMQLFAGPLCHRWNTHRVVGTFLIASAVGSLLTAVATNGYMVGIGRTLIGLGVGPIYISTIYYVFEKTSSKVYPIAIGAVMMIGNLGSALSSGPLKKIIDVQGTANTFYGITVLLLLGSVVLFILDALDKNKIVKKSEKERVLKNLKDAIIEMAHSPLLILGAFMWLMFNSFQLTYQGLWSSKWFVASYPNLPSSIAPWGATIASIGLSISTLVTEPLRVKKHPVWMSTIISEFLFVLMGFMIVLTHNLGVIGIKSTTLIIVILLVCDYLLGHVMGAVCLMLTSLTSIRAKKEHNATIMGIMNGCGSISCLFFQFLTGRMYDSLSPRMSANASYTIIFTMMSTIVLVVAIGASITQKKGR